MVLCFGFVLQALLTIQGSFHYCWAALRRGQGLFCSPSHQAHLGKKLWWGTHLWQLTPADQADIPYHVRTSSAVKSCRKKEEWKTFRVMDIQNNGICLPGWLSCMMESCFPWDDWTPACPWKVVNEFLGLLRLRAQFLLSLSKSLYLKAMSFVASAVFWLSSPSPCMGVSKWLCRA